MRAMPPNKTRPTSTFGYTHRVQSLLIRRDHVVGVDEAVLDRQDEQGAGYRRDGLRCRPDVLALLEKWPCRRATAGVQLAGWTTWPGGRGLPTTLTGSRVLSLYQTSG